jgi:hypothetical protein
MKLCPDTEGSFLKPICSFQLNFFQMKKYLIFYSSFLLVITSTFMLASWNPPAPCCITFDAAPFSIGTTYGTPTQRPGSRIFRACTFDVTINKLSTSGTPQFNFAKVVAATASFGSGNILNTNNVILVFKNTGGSLSTVTFDYLDMGGTENLSVNGVLFSGSLNAAPATLGGINVSVSETIITGGRKGTVKLSGGTIRNFGIGGQEFYLDNICRR